MRKLVLSILVLAAVGAMAQGGGMQPVVASDGTVLIVRPLIANDYRMTSELIAVSPAGATLWKWEGGAAMHTLTVRDARVFVAAGSSTMPMNEEDVVALSLATGAVQWRREMTDAVAGIEATADRVYVVTHPRGSMRRGMNGGTNGGMNGGMHRGSGAATLHALDIATGATLWSLELK